MMSISWATGMQTARQHLRDASTLLHHWIDALKTKISAGFNASTLARCDWCGKAWLCGRDSLSDRLSRHSPPHGAMRSTPPEQLQTAPDSFRRRRSGTAIAITQDQTVSQVSFAKECLMPHFLPPSSKPVSRSRGDLSTATRTIRSRWSAAERAWRRQVAQLRLSQLLRQLDAGIA